MYVHAHAKPRIFIYMDTRTYVRTYIQNQTFEWIRISVFYNAKKICKMNKYIKDGWGSTFRTTKCRMTDISEF